MTDNHQAEIQARVRQINEEIHEVVKHYLPSTDDPQPAPEKETEEWLTALEVVGNSVMLALAYELVMMIAHLGDPQEPMRVHLARILENVLLSNDDKIKEVQTKMFRAQQRNVSGSDDPH